MKVVEIIKTGPEAWEVRDDNGKLLKKFKTIWSAEHFAMHHPHDLMIARDRS